MALAGASRAIGLTKIEPRLAGCQFGLFKLEMRSGRRRGQIDITTTNKHYPARPLVSIWAVWAVWDA